MTTTAHDDQFTDAPEPVHQPYDTGSILRRNVADLELALKQQTERAEAAEAELLAVREDNHSMMLEIDELRKELAKMREKEPVAWDCGGSITANSGYAEWFSRKDHGAAVPLYTSPVPAPAVPEFCAVEAQLTLAETEMLNAKAWSAGTQAKRHIDFAMTAICCARALLQSAEAIHD